MVHISVMAVGLHCPTATEESQPQRWQAKPSNCGGCRIKTVLCYLSWIQKIEHQLMVLIVAWLVSQLAKADQLLQRYGIVNSRSEHGAIIAWYLQMQVWVLLLTLFIGRSASMTQCGCCCSKQASLDPIYPWCGHLQRPSLQCVFKKVQFSSQ